MLAIITASTDRTLLDQVRVGSQETQRTNARFAQVRLTGSHCARCNQCTVGMIGFRRKTKYALAIGGVDIC